MNDWLTDLRFWEQIKGDSRRTVVTHPDNVKSVRSAVAEAGVSHLVTVLANAQLPLEHIYMIDTPAMEAYERQEMQAMLRRPLF